MTRKAMFDAVRPLVPGRTFTPAQIAAGNAFADALGFPKEGAAFDAAAFFADVRKRFGTLA